MKLTRNKDGSIRIPAGFQAIDENDVVKVGYYMESRAYREWILVYVGAAVLGKTPRRNSCRDDYVRVYIRRINPVNGKKAKAKK